MNHRSLENPGDTVDGILLQIFLNIKEITEDRSVCRQALTTTNGRLLRTAFGVNDTDIDTDTPSSLGVSVMTPRCRRHFPFRHPAASLVKVLETEHGIELLLSTCSV